MPAKPSGEIKTCIVKAKQKNGDTYVLERQILYNPETKNNQTIKSTLIGKIPSGSTEMVPTRPRRRPEADDSKREIHAERRRVGMMDILAHVGKESGIDKSIYASADLGTAQKILSLARYLVATNGQPLPGIVPFQYNHPLPYEDGLSESVYHNLFEQIGLDASIEQSFFQDRCRLLGSDPTIAYDSTSISTYSDGQIEARRGWDKNGDGLPEIKFLVLYAALTRQPITFRKLPGNIGDVSTIRYALRQLEVLGVKHAEIVTDNGYHSQYNIADMFKAGFRFITLIKTSAKFVSQAIEDHREDFLSMSTTVPFDPAVHAVSVVGTQPFAWRRCNASSAKGLKKGDTEVIRRRIYTQVYYDSARKADEDRAFDAKVLTVKKMLEDGARPCELGDTAGKIASKYLIVKERGGQQTVAFNEEACAERKKRNGFFALVANKRKDPFDCLSIYRKRALIELTFEIYKDKLDGERPRVWTAEVLQGRMFVQFVALCYHEYFAQQVRSIIRKLEDPDFKLESEKGITRSDIEKLRRWLQETSLHNILLWFDTVECTNVSIKLRRKRLRTEITARDRLFLKLLGMS